MQRLTGEVLKRVSTVYNLNVCSLRQTINKRIDLTENQLHSFGHSLEEATSWITHLEKTGPIFQVCHSLSVLISLSRNHPCLNLVYYHFFAVFLP